MSKDLKTLHVAETEPMPVYAMSTADAAAFVGLSVKTLANLRSEGSGPPFTKVGGKVIYRTRDLKDWIDSYF